MTPASGGPGVSVVIPTRQRPELLVRALRSIDEQRYPGHVEILVVHDQEEPQVPVLTPREGRSLRILQNDRTPGLAGARNSGILASSSDLIAHCDDDDEWLPEKLARQVVRFQAEAADVVASGVAIVYQDRTVDRIPATSKLRFEDLLRSRVQEVHPSSLIARRACYEDGAVGLIDEELPGSYGEDYDWLLRAARQRPIDLVQEVLVKAYWHRSSFFADRWATIADALEYMVRKHPEFARDRRGLARIYGQIAFARAAQGRSRSARMWARRTLSVDPRERRAYLALGVSTGLVPADAILRLAHRVGKGI